MMFPQVTIVYAQKILRLTEVNYGRIYFFSTKRFFNTVLYTGNGTAIGSGGNAITGVGFQPDFTWIKNREQTDNHILTDAVRGATKYVSSDDADLQYTNTEYLTAFGADGFTVGSGNPVNTNTEDFASWNWKMGTTSGLTGGTITPTAYSISTTAGQSIIAYTGTGSNATVPHGLGVAPRMVIVKRLNSSDNWTVGHQNMKTSSPWDWAAKLNTTAAPGDDNTQWNDTAPTATVFSIGTSTEVNTNTSTYIAYCFAPIPGYSSFGSYTGTSNVDGAFVYTGFRPAFVITKATSGTIYWNMFDTKRKPYNPEDPLWANTTGTEASIGAYNLDLLSNGFKPRSVSSQINASGNSPYIYLAFAEQPTVSSNDVPAVAR